MCRCIEAEDWDIRMHKEAHPSTFVPLSKCFCAASKAA